MIDPRLPVIVGQAQINREDGDNEPIALMSEAVSEALANSGAVDHLRSKVGSVRVLKGLWSYDDPGRLVAEDLGFGKVQTTLNPIGGNETYDLVNSSAADIQAGRLDVVVVCGAEAARTSRRLAKLGEMPPKRDEPTGAAPDEVFGKDVVFEDDLVGSGAYLPVNFYAMAESALRHARGESVDEHRKRIADLWARASEIAADNPYAATRRAIAGDEVGTTAGSNRMIAAPYTKLMTANIDVDMSAAIVMCSLGTARAAGIADSELTFVTCGAGANDSASVTERWALHQSPAMRIAGRRALELADLDVDAIDDIDLYSCFPVAVELAQEHLGIDPDRPYTITGGLTFAGGPFNSYCLHAVATACDRLRAGRSRRSLLSGNGGFFSKHSFTVLSSEPPAAGFHYDRPQASVDAEPLRPRPKSTPSTAEIESYTVTFGRDGEPTKAIVTVLDTDGSRHWAASKRAEVIEALLGGDRVGASAHLDSTADERVEIVQVT